MLFCKWEFALFLTLVFVAYWSLASRWARALLLLLAGSYFLHLTVKCATSASRLTWSVYGRAVWDGLSFEGLAGWLLYGVCPLPGLPPLAQRVLQQAAPAYWVAGIIVVALLLAFRVGTDRGRVWLLVLSSFYFYACFNQWLALLICVSTAFDYLIARGLDAWSWQRGRQLLLAASLVANLGLLCYFKYANFFLRSLEEALQGLGAETSLPLLQVILPVGISFYTFEAINYTVDVYRRRVPAERNLANFLLFITFFPHLVAGPIVRARDFLPQIRRAKHWDWTRLDLGARYLILGLAKKWIIADRMAQYVDPIFRDPTHYGSDAVWLAVLAYALQIYADFSGYSDMAIGSAHLLGYKLSVNFNMPYISANLSEFWRRWHISLSSWLRDYLFIPLGGSRGARWRTCLNLLITMVLGGLWHGASWTFVVWGLLHGSLLVVHRLFRDFCVGRPRLEGLLRSVPGTALRVSLTFFAVMVCWVFFRAQETPPPGDPHFANLPHLSAFQVAWTVLHRMVVHQSGLLGAPLSPRGLWYTVLVVALGHMLGASGLWRRLVVRLPAPVLGFGYASVVTLAMVLAPDAGKQFIYFQF